MKPGDSGSESNQPLSPALPPDSKTRSDQGEHGDDCKSCANETPESGEKYNASPVIYSNSEAFRWSILPDWLLMAKRSLSAATVYSPGEAEPFYTNQASSNQSQSKTNSTKYRDEGYTAHSGANLPTISANNLKRNYRDGDRELAVLRGVNLRVEAGEILAICGPSGCGKTTLLNILGLLDRPTHGNLNLFGQDVLSLADWQRTSIRARLIGYVFQQFSLLEPFNLWQNIRVQARIAGKPKTRDQIKARLATVGLAERIDHMPNHLSGGEQQRAAIIRALIHDPRLLLCDEPTGSLDPSTGGIVLDQLLRLASEAGTTVIIVTHDAGVAASANRIVTLD